MPNTPQHWDEIFEAKKDAELGWYEGDVGQTLKFIEAIPELSASTVFLTGAGMSVLVDALLPRCQHLILNDISQIALEKLKERLPEEKK